jgi:hypothetical protein
VKRDTLSLLVIFALLAGALVWQSGKLELPTLPWVTPAPAKVTAATYIYEKDSGSVPPPVLAALDKLNRAGIVATTFEEDTVDGTGETPEQYKVSLKAAQEAGLPALVVLAGDKVTKIIKAPETEADVEGAVK